ncbi:glycerophosphodiester phosphodiesterase family protein [Tabrizicola oligotrophica]|uniref:Phosphodiesterase n=1 Tax=Tabrizicola oligotrophica TaxID=2710650 RepID=A0A6M0QR77_9RHOB|nr:glycerophosphodiester phosphodiesterase family protein [Tabrizicola oligotrophica]NEY89995.1 phosphodiesterase [Tabrizicola oligotrophica]
MTMPLPAVFLRLPLAHRALHNRAERRPENSPAAIRAAVAAGYGIEIDVQGTADGQAVVFHDEWLERLTDATGFVKDYTAAELGRIRLRDCDDCIPTLPEVLALVAGRVPVLIEIKDQTDRMAETDGRLEAAVTRALAGYQAPVAVMSFNPHAVANMARLAPAVPHGLTTAAYDHDGWAPLPPARCDELRHIADYDRVGASFISHEAADLASPRVAALKAGGAAILTWTIRSPQEESLARKVADNVTFEGYLASLPA